MSRRRETASGTVVAVIDIGSNSGRVMVFERDSSSHLRLLAGSRAALRLVHDVDERGELGDATMARATEALRDFQAIATGAGASPPGSMATSGSHAVGASGFAALADRARLSSPLGSALDGAGPRANRLCKRAAMTVRSAG